MLLLCESAQMNFVNLGFKYAARDSRNIRVDRSELEPPRLEGKAQDISFSSNLNSKKFGSWAASLFFPVVINITRKVELPLHPASRSA